MCRSDPFGFTKSIDTARYYWYDLNAFAAPSKARIVHEHYSAFMEIGAGYRVSPENHAVINAYILEDLV